MHIKDEVICIKKVDYSETSLILTLFCRNTGKVQVIAKGAKRKKSPFGATIGLFSVGEAVFLPSSGDSLSTLAEFDHLPRFVNLRTSLFSITAATMVCEIINLLTDDYDPHRCLYDKFITFLEDISVKSSKDYQLGLIAVFELNILAELGIAIPQGSCSNCGNPLKSSREVFFCGGTGGLICQDCEPNFTDKIKIAPKAAKALAEPKFIVRLSSADLWNLERVLIYYFAYIANKMPKSAAFFMKQNGL